MGFVLARPHIRIRRRGGALLGTVLLLCLVGTAASAAPAEEESEDGSRHTIVSDARELSQDEIREHDVTGTSRGEAVMAGSRRRGSGDADRRSMRTYVFGEQEMTVSTGTPLTVIVGRNADGEEVYEVIPATTGVDVGAQAGYAVPPSSAWKYSTDGYFDTTAGTWYRETWWTLTKANDWKSCSSCTAHDYWRIHGKTRAAAVTGSSASEGYKRAWLEFQRKSDWPTVNSFESDTPEESYAGVANQTTTVGFGSTFGFNIGVPPLQANGSVNTTYGGSMTKSSENWHPVVRNTVGNGGVQWCRYESAEFTGTKIIAARTGVRISSTATRGNWNMLTGQQDYTSSCPTQI